jgi:hypothetical protein
VTAAGCPDHVRERCRRKGRRGRYRPIFDRTASTKLVQTHVRRAWQCPAGFCPGPAARRSAGPKPAGIGTTLPGCWLFRYLSRPTNRRRAGTRRGVGGGLWGHGPDAGRRVNAEIERHATLQREASTASDRAAQRQHMARVPMPEWRGTGLGLENALRRFWPCR